MINVLCRDGVRAKVQIVPYLGIEQGYVIFGWRMSPDRNPALLDDGPDVWDVDGSWSEDHKPHPFDIQTATTLSSSQVTNLVHG